jgi:hypothetical protein
MRPTPHRTAAAHDRLTSLVAGAGTDPVAGVNIPGWYDGPSLHTMTRHLTGTGLDCASRSSAISGHATIRITGLTPDPVTVSRCLRTTTVTLLILRHPGPLNPWTLAALADNAELPTAGLHPDDPAEQVAVTLIGDALDNDPLVDPPTPLYVFDAIDSLGGRSIVLDIARQAAR